MAPLADFRLSTVIPKSTGGKTVALPDRIALLQGGASSARGGPPDDDDDADKPPAQVAVVDLDKGLVVRAIVGGRETEGIEFTADGKHILFWGYRSWALMDPDGSNQAHINQAKLTWFGGNLGYGYFAELQPTS